MIERYSRPEISKLWSDENKFATWLKVELAVLKVLETERTIPRGTAQYIAGKAKIDVRRILTIEKTVRHDVIAFTTSIAEQVGEKGRFFHYGLTSSDVVDTSLALLLVQSIERIIDDLVALDAALVQKANAYKGLACIGRTHGIHAEPTSFGLRFLGWVEEFRRHQRRLEAALKEIRVGKLSGAVGSYGVLSPEIEKKALRVLNLEVETVATQVLPRDRHAAFFNALAQVACSIERVAVEIRHLQRTEVHEIEEAFEFGQKGSSAMPHKRNPISAENLTGCARLMRGYASAAMENVALWHERDISHSSVERVIGPDATILLDYMLVRLTGLVRGLVVQKKNIERNLSKTQGIYFSGHVLLALVEKGLTREEAYSLVQKAAHAAWDNERWFGDELLTVPRVKEALSSSELKKILNVKNYLGNVDAMYARVLGRDRSRPKKK